MSDPNHTPALTPPPGVEPNFIDPPTLMSDVTIGSIFVLTILTALTATRTFTKLCLMRDFHLEDCEFTQF